MIQTWVLGPLQWIPNPMTLPPKNGPNSIYYMISDQSAELICPASASRSKSNVLWWLWPDARLWRLPAWWLWSAGHDAAGHARNDAWAARAAGDATDESSGSATATEFPHGGAMFHGNCGHHPGVLADSDDGKWCLSWNQRLSLCLAILATVDIDRSLDESRMLQTHMTYTYKNT